MTQSITTRADRSSRLPGLVALTAAWAGLFPAAVAAPSLATLYSFQGGSDGAGPVSGLVEDASGALYGTTPAGGVGGIECRPGCGTVFKLTPPAAGQTQWTETVLYRFIGKPDGAAPMASLALDQNGVLYGTTSTGGQHGLGSVFSLTPPALGQTAWTEKVIYSFKRNRHAGPNETHRDGSDPVAPVFFDKSGNLYGTTYHGGMTASFDSAGLGTVFRLEPPASGQTEWTETQLHVFVIGPHDGAYPTAGLVEDASGALYGSTSQYANNGPCGSVFKLTPPLKGKGAWNEQTLAILTDYESICHPTGPLYIGPLGLIYDTSISSNGSFYGSVFSLTPPVAGQKDWSINAIYIAPNSGFIPYSGVIPDSVGNFYGTTAGYSTEVRSVIGASIFKLLPPPAGQALWTRKNLVLFDGADGALPKSSLLLANDGTLYGTSEAGGAYGLGTVFALARPGP